MGTVIGLTAFGIISIRSSGYSTDVKSLWAIGFGTVNPATIITWNLATSGAAGIVGNAFMANLPQVILSFIYFSYNAIFTSMFLGAEWQSYMSKRKGLRVSDCPEGAQRTTYFLQLPYRAGIPLMCTSALLHWLVSQSIFLVDVETYSWNDMTGTYGHSSLLRYESGAGDVPDESANVNLLSCGFSPMPMIAVIIVGVAMAATLLFVGRKRFKTPMPVVTSNSIGISAACHLDFDEADEVDVAYQPLQWGATRHRVDGIGHCGFSSKEVTTPEYSQLYA